MLAFLLASLLACTGDTSDAPDDTTNSIVDVDGDGSPADEDCDDDDPAAYPGAVELCDDVDQDCDGTADNGVETTYYLDHDGDGYGVNSDTVEACAAPDGYAAAGGDCDDNDAFWFHPDAVESCDGADNDCDGEIDEDGESLWWFEDDDGDGYGFGSATDGVLGCNLGGVPYYGDCDDGDATVHPDAEEVCDGVDNDCDDATPADEGC
jgi:hypothetical protein